MLYYQKSSFSGLQLCASYDYWATAPNMHHCLFTTHHFVHISSIARKTRVACKSITYQMTSLLLRMLCFTSKVAKRLQPTRYSLYRHHCLVVWCVSTNGNTTQGALQLHYNTVTITFLPWLHLSERQTEVRLTSCCAAAIAVSLHYYM